MNGHYLVFSILKSRHVEGDHTAFSQLADHLVKRGLQFGHGPPDHAHTHVSGNAGLRPVFNGRGSAKGREALRRDGAHEGS